MRLCRYDDDRLGVVIGAHVHDVSAIQQEIRQGARYDMFGDPVIAALPQWRERIERAAEAARRIPLADVALLAPVARPSKVMAAPTNYANHIAEMEARNKDQPVAPRFIEVAGLFLKANSSIVGPSGAVEIQFPDRLNEHEVELVMVIGKAGRNITQERALEHVAGYCMGIDMTVRGKEDRSFRKSLDGFSPVGPWLVTADEIADPDRLPIELTVNGQPRQQASTENLIFSCRKLIEFASAYYTLHPGDYLFTGTPEGVGPVGAGDWLCASSPLLGELRIQAVQRA
jgi:2,4-diketo-3-deoxy-L-fuconate hydrolase